MYSESYMKLFFVWLMVFTIQCQDNQYRGGGATTSLSFADKTVNTNVFEVVNYQGKFVYIYGSMVNDLANKQEPYKWIFFYVPLLIPVNQQSLSETSNWVELTRYKMVKIHLTQGNDELEKMIRESLTKKVSDSIAVYASSWTIKPLIIDWFTAYIVRKDVVVPGIEPCRVLNPQSIEFALNFGLMSTVDEDYANQVVERIQHGDYQIQMSIQFAGFSKMVNNVVSYSFESIQEALANTLANGPSTPKYILRSQRNSFVQEISSKIKETIVIENNNKSMDLEGLRLMFTALVESSFSKAQEVKAEMGQLANVWSADDLTPDFIESEVNKLFKYDQSETERKRDDSKYFEVDKSHMSGERNETSSSRNHGVNAGGGAYGFGLNAGYKTGKSSGQAFASNLHDQIRGKNQDQYSEADIKKILEMNSVEMEWHGQKFVPKSIKVIKIADILHNIKASLVSKQIELEKQEGVTIKTVNHGMIVDSELESKFGPKLFSTITYHNMDVRVFSLERNGDNSSTWSFFFVPLMQPARDTQSSDSNNHSWIRAVSANQINVQLIQFTQQLKEQIRVEVSKSQPIKAFKNLKPFFIDSLTCSIKNGKHGIEGVESYVLSGLNEKITTVQFRVSSDAQQIVEKILSQEYVLEVSMWLKIPSGSKSSQVSSSPIIRIVSVDASILFESNPHVSRLQEKMNALETRQEATHKEMKGLSEVTEQLKTQINDAHRKLAFPRSDLPASISTGSKKPMITVLKHHGYFAAGHESMVGIKIYDLQSRQLIRTIKTSSYIYDLKSLRENQLIQASGGGKINIWNVDTGELSSSYQGHSGKDVYGITLNKNESLMLSGGQDYNVVLWDMIGYKQVRVFNGHTHWVYTVEFNEQKNQVISGSNDNTIRVWSMNDGSLVRILTGHSYWIHKVVLDEESGLLYSGSWDNTIKEWNLENGECLKTLAGHTSNVYDLILSQQGDWLASASLDKSTIIWDKSAGSIIRRLNYTDIQYRLAINPLNGQLISTSYHTGKILFW